MTPNSTPDAQDTSIQATKPAASALREMVDLRDRTLQKARIQFANRLSALHTGTDVASPETEAIITRWAARFLELEQEADEDIRQLARAYPIIDVMSEVKGIGPLLAAKIVAMIDIKRSNTVSSFWRYAGYGVIDGARERPTKGERMHYNARLKTTLFILAGSFMRSGSPYRSIYDNARAYYDANRPEWTPGHKHAAAQRKMIKVFLAHLWVTWRTMEGLPTRDLYVMDYGGHTTYITPQEMGWPEPGAEKPAPRRRTRKAKPSE